MTTAPDESVGSELSPSDGPRASEADLVEALFTVTSTGFAVVDRGLTVHQSNAPFAELAGSPPSVSHERGRPRLGDPPDEVRRVVAEALEDGHVHEAVVTRGEDSGIRRWRVRARAAGVGLVVVGAEELTAQQRAEALAFSDALTGLANRRAFLERLRAEIERARRHDRPLALALIDLDEFKAINDRFGHEAGDTALEDLAAHLRGDVRVSDLLARIGGDEFALIMPETQLIDAQSLAERTVARVAAAARGDRKRVTISVGLSCLEDVDDLPELMRAADRALYAAKADGRNCVRGHTEATDVLTLTREKRRARNEVAAGIRALARTVDVKQPATREHSDRVAEVAARLAEVLDWPPERIDRLREAALVHDVGKIAVPDAVLLKPGPLTAEEYEMVKTHAELGVQIVAESLDDEQVLWVRAHHEHHDGAGYPDGLAGESIPDGARLLAAAEAWDAMTSDQPYRAERSVDDAREELRRCSGSQFSPDVVAAFDAPTFRRYRRILANERAARDDNLRHLEATPADPDAILDLACECFDADCEARVGISRRELAAVRTHQRRFVVAPGHVMLDAESVVLDDERFLVVEKRM